MAAPAARVTKKTTGDESASGVRLKTSASRQLTPTRPIISHACLKKKCELLKPRWYTLQKYFNSNHSWVPAQTNASKWRVNDDISPKSLILKERHLGRGFESLGQGCVSLYTRSSKTKYILASELFGTSSEIFGRLRKSSDVFRNLRICVVFENAGISRIKISHAFESEKFGRYSFAGSKGSKCRINSGLSWSARKGVKRFFPEYC